MSASSPPRHYFKDVPYIRESDYLLIVSENLRLRDKLLECAKECAPCGGTGMITLMRRSANESLIVEECSTCADIRSVLA